MNEAPSGQRSRRSASLRLLGRVAALALRALGATWRIQSEGSDPLACEAGPQIGATWHRDLLLTAHHFRDRGFSVAISRSRDGERISAALPALGYREPVRGSSSRGGAAALRGLVRLIAAGTTVSVQCDGPRGPTRKAKIGVVSLARLSGVAITPVAFSARPCLRMPSWDATLVPLPFARVWVAFGEPLEVPPGAGEEAEEELRRRLDERLNALTRALDARAKLVGET